MKLVLIVALLSLTLSSIPKEYNWNRVNGITGAGNQGSCDSAGGWVTATMWETEYWRQTGVLPVTSVQHLLSCSGRMSCTSGSTNYEDFERLVYYTASAEMAYDSEFPYGSTAVTSGTPAFTNCSSGQRYRLARPIRVHKAKKVSVGRMKNWIARAPVGTMIAKQDVFTNYRGSSVLSCTVNSPADSALNHAVVAIGYTADSDFIVQNSAGTTWGNNGIGTLKKDKECGIRRRIYRYNWSLKTAVTLFVLFISFIAI